MIKSLELKKQIFIKTDTLFKELEQEKNTLTTKEYKKRKKEINNYAKQQIKLIDKAYPIKKEIKKLMNEDNNE